MDRHARTSNLLGTYLSTNQPTSVPGSSSYSTIRSGQYLDPPSYSSTRRGSNISDDGYSSVANTVFILPRARIILSELDKMSSSSLYFILAFFDISRQYYSLVFFLEKIYRDETSYGQIPYHLATVNYIKMPRNYVVKYKASLGT